MKLQVNVSNEMVEKIDRYAEILGVSRSALCATLIGQGMLGHYKDYGFGEKENRRSGENKK